MAFHGAGYPQAVDVDIALGFDGHPRVLRRDVLDKALAPLLAPVKHKTLAKPLLEPFLFGHALLARHGAADMLGVNVVFRDPNKDRFISSVSTQNRAILKSFQ